MIILYFDLISVKSFSASLHKSFINEGILQERNATEIAESICKNTANINSVMNGRIKKKIAPIKSPAIILTFSPNREAMSPVGISARSIEIW